MRRNRDDGQASAELIAAIPALLLAFLAVAQLAVVGYSLWAAGVAARAGARAAYVGGDGGRAARASLPEALRDAASIDDRGGLVVRVRVPSLLPAVPRVPISARAGFGVGDAG